MGVIRGLRHEQLLRSDSRVPATLGIVVRLAHLVTETGVLIGMFRCTLLLRADVANITLPRVPATAATIDLILFLRLLGDSFHAAAASFSISAAKPNAARSQTISTSAGLPFPPRKDMQLSIFARTSSRAIYGCGHSGRRHPI